MANRLRMVQVQSIQALIDRGWSHRRIARELGIHRETVGRYARLLGESRATPCLKPAISTPGVCHDVAARPDPSAPGRRSSCEPWREVIVGKLEQGLSAQRIYQDLVVDSDFDHSYQSVKRFVRSLRLTLPLAFRRIESPPGEEAQVDFGRGAWVQRSHHRRRRPHLFRIVLSYSRKAYSEVVWQQTTEVFIQCLENAFHSFGGVPRTLVIDNLKAAVTKADWFDPELHPRIQAFARHYGVVILPTKPYTPRHKGKVEAAIKYSQENATKGRCFQSLEDHNRFLEQWERSIADQRIHGTTRQQVGQRFEKGESDALLPLPRDRFPFFHEAERRVHRDGHVALEKAFYSVPPEFIGRVVWVRWDSRMVRIYDQNLHEVALHIKKDPGRFSTHEAHISSKKRCIIEEGALYLLGRARQIGPQSARWCQAVIENRGVQGLRVVQGFLGLTRRHHSDSIEHASNIARSHGAFRLRDVKSVLRNPTHRAQVEFLDSHPLIRDLREYEHILSEALDRSSNSQEPTQ